MRFTVSAMRDVAAERRAREKAEAPTVKTEEQMKADEEKKQKRKSEKAPSSFLSVWKRKFRPLPEEKAVDLFADVIGDTFILSIAVGLIMWEYIKGRQKPDTNAIKISELEVRLLEEERRIAELEDIEKRQQERVSILEQALEALERPTAKKRAQSVA